MCTKYDISMLGSGHILNIPEETDLLLKVGNSIEDMLGYVDVNELDGAISSEADSALVLPPPPSSFVIPALSLRS